MLVLEKMCQATGAELFVTVGSDVKEKVDRGLVRDPR